MKITDEIKGDVAIIHLEGKVMGGPDATMFHGRLHEIVKGGKKHVVIDLAKVEWMSSVGLGMLISALTTLKNNQGELKLASVTKSIQSLLTITRLITIFETYDSIEQAIKSFSD
ncbi:MAG: STAS domain-containing protein [candidate division Zixibacteria bacterium]|nr:STAS domain-containing protein [candidate division Zixibacteria bacterium]